MNQTNFWARVASLVAVVLALAGCRTDGKPRTGLTTATPLWEKDITLYSVQSMARDDIIFLIGSNSDADTQLTALQARTGEILWELKSPEVGTSNSVKRYQNLVLVAWEDFSSRNMLVVAADTGERLWRLELPDDPSGVVYSAPILDGDRIIMQDGYTGFVVYESTTGTEQWRVTIDRPYIFDESRESGVPVIKDFTAVQDGKMHYLTSDGMWGTIDFGAQSTAETPITFRAPADLLLGQRQSVVYDLSPDTMALNLDDTLIGIDKATLTEIWRESGFLTTQIRHMQDGLFFTSPYRAYDERTGEIVWERAVEGATRGLGGVEYAEPSATILDLRREELGVKGISMATGEELWTVTLPDIAPTSRYTDLMTDGNAFVVGVVECDKPSLDPCPEIESSIFAYDLTTQALLWRYTAKDALIVGIEEGVAVLNVDNKKIGVGVP